MRFRLGYTSRPVLVVGAIFCEFMWCTAQVYEVFCVPMRTGNVSLCVCMIM